MPKQDPFKSFELILFPQSFGYPDYEDEQLTLKLNESKFESNSDQLVYFL